MSEITLRHKIPCCQHSNPALISTKLLTALNFINTHYTGPLRYSSGIRCIACNALAGGVARSEHITGEAVDILASTSRMRILIIGLALNAGIRRIGVARNFIHIGVNADLDQDVLWVY